MQRVSQKLSPGNSVKQAWAELTLQKMNSHTPPKYICIGSAELGVPKSGGGKPQEGVCCLFIN